MEEALIALLLADTALAPLVGPRINWQVRPQGDALPGVTLQRISGARDYANSGPTGLVQSRIQADCWGATYVSALAVSRAVRNALSGIRTTVNGIDFQGAFIDLERHDFEKDANAAQAFHRVMIDFQIWHSE